MIWAWIDTSRAEIGSSQTMREGSTGQGPGDADALALPAAELMGDTVCHTGVEADDAK